MFEFGYAVAAAGGMLSLALVQRVTRASVPTLGKAMTDTLVDRITQALTQYATRLDTDTITVSFGDLRDIAADYEQLEDLTSMNAASRELNESYAVELEALTTQRNDLAERYASAVADLGLCLATLDELATAVTAEIATRHAAESAQLSAVATPTFTTVEAGTVTVRATPTAKPTKKAAKKSTPSKRTR